MKTKKLLFLIAVIMLISKTIISQTEFEWAQYYSDPNFANEAFASFVDADGNTYITGRSNDWGSPALMDMTTVKYDKDGNLLWVNRINGLCNEDDEARDIYVDDDGYVYVCGFAGACYDFDDYAVVKYGPNGNLVWQAGYNSPPHPDMPYHDRAEKLFVDEHKNVYVTGKCYQWDETNFILHWNIGTVKYDKDGNLLWADLYNTPENNNEYPVGIHVNQFGEVLVAGYTKDPTLFDQSDWVVLMYDSLGNRVWEHRFNGAENGEDEAAVLTGDRFGNFYVGGLKDQVPNDSDSDMYLVKYERTGNIAWTVTEDFDLPGQSGMSAVLTNMKINSKDELYISVGNFGSKGNLLKYDLDGNLLWNNAFSPATMVYACENFCFDSEGNIYLTGAQMTAAGEGLLATKYDTLGNFVWEELYEGDMKDPDSTLWTKFALGIGVDKDNSVYLTGTSGSAGRSYMAVKYNQVITSVLNEEIVSDFKLYQNYPNPFNPNTKIGFSLPYREEVSGVQSVRLTIYDISGREIEMLINKEMQPGNYEIVFNGSYLPSGVYFYRLNAGDFSESRKMMLLK